MQSRFSNLLLNMILASILLIGCSPAAPTPTPTPAPKPISALFSDGRQGYPPGVYFCPQGYQLIEVTNAADMVEGKNIICVPPGTALTGPYVLLPNSFDPNNPLYILGYCLPGDTYHNVDSPRVELLRSPTGMCFPPGTYSNHALAPSLLVASYKVSKYCVDTQKQLGAVIISYPKESELDYGWDPQHDSKTILQTTGEVSDSINFPSGGQSKTFIGPASVKFSMWQCPRGASVRLDYSQCILFQETYGDCVSAKNNNSGNCQKNPSDCTSHAISGGGLK